MSTKTHTAIAATAVGVVDAVQLSTPTPGRDQVLVKAEYASLIAFDTYQVDLGFFVQGYPNPLGSNASGTVVEVGDGVGDLKPGDRVVALTFGAPQNRASQEYILASKYEVAKVPENFPLVSAASIPDNFVTAYWTLTSSLGFSLPYVFPAATPPPEADVPILIYGSGATVGQHLIQILALSGFKTIITTASKKHHDYLRSLGATHVFDYNAPDLSDLIIGAAGGKVKYVVDCISASGTLAQIAKVVEKGSKVAYLVPIKHGNSVTTSTLSDTLTEENNPFSDGVELIATRTFLYTQNETMKEKLMPEIVAGLLASGRLQPNRVRLLETGSFLDRVKEGLDLLRNNKVSGEKIVVKVP